LPLRPPGALKSNAASSASNAALFSTGSPLQTRESDGPVLLIPLPIAPDLVDRRRDIVRIVDPPSFINHCSAGSRGMVHGTQPMLQYLTGPDSIIFR
jgi:hypothetical protein